MVVVWSKNNMRAKNTICAQHPDCLHTKSREWHLCVQLQTNLIPRVNKWNVLNKVHVLEDYSYVLPTIILVNLAKLYSKSCLKTTFRTGRENSTSIHIHDLGYSCTRTVRKEAAMTVYLDYALTLIWRPGSSSTSWRAMSLHVLRALGVTFPSSSQYRLGECAKSAAGVACVTRVFVTNPVALPIGNRTEIR
jgi:hypothetical protein